MVYPSSQQTNHKTTIRLSEYYATKPMLAMGTSTTGNLTTKGTTPCNCYKHDDTQYEPCDGKGKAIKQQHI